MIQEYVSPTQYHKPEMKLEDVVSSNHTVAAGEVDIVTVVVAGVEV